MEHNEYTDGNSAWFKSPDGKITGHVDMGSTPVLIKNGDKSWLFEWHPYCGPMVLSKRTEDPLTKQPGQHSPFWLIVVWWHDQGGKVVDGVGVWSEPKIVEHTAQDRHGRPVKLRTYESGPDWTSPDSRAAKAIVRESKVSP